MTKKLDEDKMGNKEGCYVVYDDGQPGYLYGVWARKEHYSSLFDATDEYSLIGSGMKKENAERVVHALAKTYPRCETLLLE